MGMKTMSMKTMKMKSVKMETVKWKPRHFLIGNTNGRQGSAAEAVALEYIVETNESI